VGAHATWSTDHGKTWLSGKPTVPNVNECQVVLLSNGSLLMNARTGSKDRLSLLSTNEGMSWSMPRVVPELGGSATCEGSILSRNGTVFFSHPQVSQAPRSMTFFARPAETVKVLSIVQHI
jgi:hypothetical protein